MLSHLSLVALLCVRLVFGQDRYISVVTKDAPELPKAPLPVAAMSKSFGSLFKTFEKNGIMDMKVPLDMQSQEAQLNEAKQHLVISRAKRMEKDMQMTDARLAFRKRDVQENAGDSIAESRLHQTIQQE